MQSRKSFARIAAVSYLLLIGIYLLYWRHAGYFVDDWFLMGRFRQVRGAAGLASFVTAAIQNNIYQKFRMHWLGILYGFVITRLGGYSAQFNFGALLLIHAACAWLLSQALWRLGLPRGLAFLAGAFYLLAPSTHFALFTNFTNPFFVLTTFWTLALLWFFAGRVAEEQWGTRTTLACCALAVAAMFSGEQTFLVLWTLLPLAAWSLKPPKLDRRALQAIGAIWIALGSCGAVFLLWINRAPVGRTGLNWRYQWSWSTLQNNVGELLSELRQMSGVGARAPFHLALNPRDDLLALGAALIVAALAWVWREDESGRSSLWRVWLFAAAAALLAYGPILLIGGGYARFRYHYAPTPYLGAGLAAICWSLRSRRLPFVPAMLGGVVAAYFALNAAAEIRQCWIPESEDHRALTACLRNMNNVAPGDILIVSGTPFEIGTAQHFTMHSSVSANPYAEWANGVAPLEVGLDLMDVHGRLTLWQADYQRPLSAADIARTHVLVDLGGGHFIRREWVAQEARPGHYRLIALKDAATPAAAQQTAFSLEQLAFLEGKIYFAPVIGPRP